MKCNIQARAGSTVKNSAIPVQISEISHHFAVAILKQTKVKQFPSPRKSEFVKFQTSDEQLYK